MGIPPTFIGWISTLYTDVSSEVLVNVFLSIRIVIKSGTCQGCLLSLILFICTTEPLAQCIRQDPMMSKVQIPGRSREETRILAYLDDLNILCHNKCSVERTMWHTQVYKVVSGVMLNVSKSTCLAMGELRDLESLGVSVLCKWVKIPRVEFNPKLSRRMAWEKKEPKVK
ncbi:hypothetical protein Y1Q_0002125 [Alligator mississippiensis]|uniref:Reverse transcriptase domain-containing protein n=1 Tax=Alligator mississippiensis TaxID=8496 RepID=A0A151MPM6_ALLMI|nr:hypothetical protein Y1Q_0002125 [Alligator mississippiensis]